MVKQLNELKPHLLKTSTEAGKNPICFGYFCNQDDKEAEFAQLVEIKNDRFLVRDNAGLKVYYDLYVQFIWYITHNKEFINMI